MIERNHIFQQFLPFGLVFGQLAWEWLKLSFATLKAYFLANYEGKTNEQATKLAIKMKCKGDNKKERSKQIRKNLRVVFFFGIVAG